MYPIFADCGRHFAPLCIFICIFICIYVRYPFTIFCGLFFADYLLPTHTTLCRCLWCTHTHTFAAFGSSFTTHTHVVYGCPTLGSPITFLLAVSSCCAPVCYFTARWFRLFPIHTLYIRYPLHTTPHVWFPFCLQHSPPYSFTNRILIWIPHHSSVLTGCRYFGCYHLRWFNSPLFLHAHTTTVRSPPFTPLFVGLLVCRAVFATALRFDSRYFTRFLPTHTTFYCFISFHAHRIPTTRGWFFLRLLLSSLLFPPRSHYALIPGSFFTRVTVDVHRHGITVAFGLVWTTTGLAVRLARVHCARSLAFAQRLSLRLALALLRFIARAHLPAAAFCLARAARRIMPRRAPRLARLRA